MNSAWKPMPISDPDTPLSCKGKKHGHVLSSTALLEDGVLGMIFPPLFSLF